MFRIISSSLTKPRGWEEPLGHLVQRPPYPMPEFYLHAPQIVLLQGMVSPQPVVFEMKSLSQVLPTAGFEWSKGGHFLEAEMIT